MKEYKPDPFSGFLESLGYKVVDATVSPHTMQEKTLEPILQELAVKFGTPNLERIKNVEKHLISSQITLLEAELERKKRMMKDTENIKAPEGADIGAYIHCESLRRDGHNKLVQEDITYLQEQIEECRKLLK